MTQFGGFWIRVVAYIIDAIVLTIATIPIALIFGISMMAGLDPTAVPDDATAGGNLLANLLSVVLGWLYYAMMESSAMQATLGKKALGMIVTDESGARISFARATGRYFAKILSALILLIGFIMVAFTERKQGLHDKLAGTLVVRGQPGQVAHAGVFE
jgi:uncharacterized RDD family membrane protein YckC